VAREEGQQTKKTHLLHVISGKLEVEYLGVGVYPSLRNGFRDDDEALHVVNISRPKVGGMTHVL